MRSTNENNSTKNIIAIFRRLITIERRGKNKTILVKLFRCKQVTGFSVMLIGLQFTCCVRKNRVTVPVRVTIVIIWNNEKRKPTTNDRT